jgi:hypothetical protein
MKKGLLSILAGALVVVGCQNYDDQFDQLESQINALASTVAGLSAVQSDLAALSAQVNSLSGAVDAAVDAALAGGLADIQSAIDALNAAAESAANNSDITQIAEDVDAVQTDLAELLAQSSVFQGDVVVNTPATLQAYHSMGEQLAIVNGFVDIDVSTDMDIAQVQELVDFILVTTEDFDYTAGDSVDTEVTFNNLSGTLSLTIDQEGGYNLQSLESATIVTLDADNSIAIVHLGALESVTSLSNGSGAGTFAFDKATELHLTSLKTYDGNLTLEVDEGGVIDLTAYRDVDADGDPTGDDLSITGPASFSVSELNGTNSTLTFEDVQTVTVNGYNGTVHLNGGVENFSSDNLVAWDIADADDLITVDVTGALETDADGEIDEDEVGPTLAVSSKGDLTDITISGDVSGITLSTNGNLVNATIDATVDGTVTIDNNSDLANLVLTGATLLTVDIDTNSDLEVLTVDASIGANDDDETIGTVRVTDNESLTDLTISTNKIGVLEITGNSDLETIDMSAVDSIGDAEGATVTVSGNNLEAEEVNAEDEEITTESGMDTLEDYLDAVVANADSTATVVFDTVETYIDADGNDDGEFTTGDQVIVLKIQPADITEGDDAIAHKNSYVLDAAEGQGLHIDIDGLDIFDEGRDDVDAAGNYVFTGNQVLDLAAITATAHVTRAAAAGVTLTAQAGGSSAITVTFDMISAATDTSTLLGERYASTAALSTVWSATTGTVSQVVGADDYVTFTVGSNSVTATGLTADQIADAIITAWTAKYSTSGSESASTLFTLTQIADGSVYVSAVKRGSAGHNADVTVSVTASSTGDTNTTGAGLEWTRGATISASDNATDSDNIILTLEAVDTPPIADPLDQASLTISSNVVTTLTTTLLVNGAGGGEKYYAAVTEDRADCALPEAGSVDVVNEAAVSKSKVDWLN